MNLRLGGGAVLKVSAVFEIRIHSLPPLPEAEGKWFPSAPAARAPLAEKSGCLPWAATGQGGVEESGMCLCVGCHPHPSQ